MKSLPLLLIPCLATCATVDQLRPNGADPVRTWLDYDQDNYALGNDDGYTAAVRGGLRYDSDRTGPWMLTASWSIFTDRNAGTRCDELLTTLQHELMFGPVRVSAGPGLLISGNLGGDRVQRAVHHVFGDEQYDLAYTPSVYLPVVAALAHWEAWRDVSEPSPLGRTAASLAFRAGAFMHRDEARLQLSALVTYEGEGGGYLQLEPFVEAIAGDSPSTVTESPHTINAGIQGHLYPARMHIGLTISRDRTYGTFGLTF